VSVRHTFCIDGSVSVRHTFCNDGSVSVRHTFCIDGRVSVRHTFCIDGSVSVRHTFCIDGSVSVRHLPLIQKVCLTGIRWKHYHKSEKVPYKIENLLIFLIIVKNGYHCRTYLTFDPFGG
jgi:alkyl hydroperoxide reductase subunit AhpC